MGEQVSTIRRFDVTKKKSEKSKDQPKEKKLRMFSSDAERRMALAQDLRDKVALAYVPPKEEESSGGVRSHRRRIPPSPETI